MADYHLPPSSVLVVEDDAALRTLFLALLTRKGYRVDCVTDGRDALDRVERYRYAAIILDLMLPLVSGFDVLAQLRAKRPDLLRSTIVTTGVSDRVLSKLDRSGIFALLRKPFDIDQLDDTVRNCIRQSALNREEPVAIDEPARRFEAALPDLKKMFSGGVVSEHELLLRDELRRVVRRVGGVLTAAASIERDAARAARFERLGRSAAMLATTGRAQPDREH